MKLLIVTQAVDTNNPVLGFFVRWIEEFAKHFEQIEIICLIEGEHASFPKNVRVHSLGKERGAVSRVVYAWRFLKLVWNLRHEYDAVFVHMNQEYILIAGWFWKILQKSVFLWRNYHGGTLVTDVAMALSDRMFCTSRFSYTASNPKTKLVPVGFDTARFYPDSSVYRTSRSVLFLSGIWPSKRPEVLIDAIKLLRERGVPVTGDIYGSPLPETEAYYEGLKELVKTARLEKEIIFHAGVQNHIAPDLFRTHEIFVNCSPSGMFDKTLFEAAACGAFVIASSADYADLVDPKLSFPDGDAQALSDRIAAIGELSQDEQSDLRESLLKVAERQSLELLAVRLAEEMKTLQG